MSSWFGGGDDPKVDYQPEEIQADRKKLKKSRTALYATAGAAAGEELQPGEVAPRDTFFGNV